MGLAHDIIPRKEVLLLKIQYKEVEFQFAYEATTWAIVL